MQEISTVARKITADARRGVIDLTQPATFTISSLGQFGVSRFLPIINPPEVAILAVGVIAPRVVPVAVTTLAHDDSDRHADGDGHDEAGGRFGLGMGSMSVASASQDHGHFFLAPAAFWLRAPP